MVDQRHVNRVGDLVWEIPRDYKDGMNVPGRLFLSEELLGELEPDTLDQVANVATLPGVQRYSMAMPDAHLGYGFPIGGVAAFDLDEGVISPGGVGFDINCGVRLLRSDLKVEDARPGLKELVELLFKNVPSGVGSKSQLRISHRELDEVFVRGSQWAVEEGYGVEMDVDHCEENGSLDGANPDYVSDKARKRGTPQLLTLGSGNHFLEVQYVDKIYDEEAAHTFGLQRGNVVAMIHCGSRGAGHQICSDYLKVMEKASKKYGIRLADKQLAAAPLGSNEAERYFGAMAAAANYAWANRQVITHWVRKTFKQHFEDDLGMDLVYDVAHNIAKFETHSLDGEEKVMCVHRKGATRAFSPHHPEVPSTYQKTGQPVIIPGSMGTPSYVLRGTNTAMDLTFGSTCHGAGRLMSRSAAKREIWGEDVQKALEERGIYVRATSGAVIAEEAPEVYKESSAVVDVVDQLGISDKVARLQPLGVVKG